MTHRWPLRWSNRWSHRWLLLLLPLALASCDHRTPYVPPPVPPPDMRARLLEYGPLAVIRQDGRCCFQIGRQWYQAEFLEDYLGNFDTLTIWTGDPLVRGPRGQGSYQLSSGSHYAGSGSILALASGPGGAAETLVVASVVSGVHRYERDSAP